VINIYQHDKNKLLKQLEKAQTIDELKQVIKNLIKSISTTDIADELVDKINKERNELKISFKSEKAKRMFGD
jgi:transcriptional accessory protein Tex/SPT6